MISKRRAKAHAQTVADHKQALTDLEAKDKIVEDLLQVAGDLVDELRSTLVEVSAALREPGEEDDDAGR